ncbi:Uncharacterised protein [Salmonella enterica subsp. enterica serovar Bovismorbificans]|nr:Uncharacterised protein [Salmonella enterica subsp. enterica serovar Bovismorbificans]
MFVIRVTVSLIATASVGAAFSALNSRYTVAFRPLLNEQTAIDMLRLEPCFKELYNSRQFRSFSIDREYFFNGIHYFVNVMFNGFLERFNILGGKQQVLDI